MSLLLLPQQHSHTDDTVLLQNSSFVRNIAHIGAAIDLYPNSSISPQVMLHAEDVQFVNNSVKYVVKQSNILMVKVKK